MELDILFLGTLFPKEIEEEIIKKSNRNMEDAGNALQWNLIKGIEKNSNTIIKLVNFIPIGSYPKRYKDCFIKSRRFEHCQGASDVDVGFFNLCYVKHVLLKYSVFRHIKRWSIEKNDKQKVLISYSLDSAFLYCVERIKKINPSIKCIAIVADLPDFMQLSNKKRILLSLYQKYNIRLTKKKVKLFDQFVLLTEQMKEYMNIKQPFIVMEGISTDAFQNLHVDDHEASNIKTILYSGTLHEKFGIVNLIEAFIRIKADNYRLVLCGVGDSEEMIIAMSKKDNRIRYLGQLPQNEVLKLQLQSTVLVNPRQNNEEFTKYSFPSKNLEYLSSGRPVIAYKLDGIPDEYNKYFQYVNDDSVGSLTEKIIEICSKDSEELNAIGKLGKEFVLSYKNKYIQTKKIVDMIFNNWE